MVVGYYTTSNDRDDELSQKRQIPLTFTFFIPKTVGILEFILPPKLEKSLSKSGQTRLIMQRRGSERNQAVMIFPVFGGWSNLMQI